MMRVLFSIACIWDIVIKELKFSRVFSNSMIRDRTWELQMIVQREREREREIKNMYVRE